MTIDDLHTFIEVARQGSFAAAARAANIDPSLVSRAIANLEEHLGFRLFHRTTRRMTLTEAGELFLQRVEAIIDELASAQDEALTLSTQPTGTLRITASVAFGQTCLVPLVSDFRQAFPAIKLELLLTDQNLDLVSERIDLAIRLAPSIDLNVVCTKLFDTRYRVCATQDYLATYDSIYSPADLSKHQMLLFSLPEFQNRWLFRPVNDNNGKIQEVPIHGNVIISNALALRSCMLAGIGPALLADWLIDGDIAARHCLDLCPHYQVTATSFETGAWLIYPSRKFLPNKVRVAIGFLKTHLKSTR